MDRPQAGGYNIYEIALSLRQTDVAFSYARFKLWPATNRFTYSFGRVFAKFFQKPQQCQPFVFRKIFLRQVSPRPLSRRAMPTRSSDKRLRKHANFGAAAAVLRTLAISARSKSDRRSPERQMAQRHVPARHLNASSDKKSMSRIVLVSAVLICGSLFVGCSRKPAQTAPPPPEVLVTTVTAA